MTKVQYIDYWRDISEKDWQVLWKLYESEDYVYCLYFSHLVIEKLSKAVWVLNSEENIPPRSHNILYILDHARIKLTEEQTDFLLILNEFNIEGRYPDYKQKIFQIATKQYTDEILIKIKEIREWLLKKLQ